MGGLYGRILALGDDRVSLRVDEGVKVEVERSKILRVVQRPGGSASRESAEASSATSRGSGKVKA